VKLSVPGRILQGWFPALDRSVSWAFLVGVCAETAALMSPSRELLNNAAVPVALRLAAWSLVPLHGLCIAWAWWWWTAAMSRLRDALPRRLGALPAGIGICVPAAFGAWYLMSWGFYGRAGVFPDLDVVRFSAINARMLCGYLLQAEPSSLLALLGVTLAAVLGTVWAWKRQQGGGRPAGGIRIVPGLLAMWAFVNVLCLLLHSSQPTKLSVTRAEAYHSPQPSLAYLLRRRILPTTSVALGLLTGEQASRQQEIPLARLVPRRPQAVEPPVRPSSPRPRIVLIVVESLRHDVVDLVHQGQEVMPHLNRLARTGTRFTRCYTQSVHSDYADPCFVSSLYPLRSERQYFYTSLTPWPKVLLWDVLHPQGYATALISSQNEAWSNMHLFYASPGLDCLFDSRSAPQLASTRGDEILVRWSAATNLAGKLDDEFTRRTACRWIADRASAGQPFFTLIVFQTSHFPYELPAGASAPFSSGVIDFEASLFGYPAERAPIARNAYFNALHYIDRQIGAIRQDLESLGIADQTVLAVVGDHGEAFYENGEGGHAQSLLETVTHVPFILHAPGRLPGGVDDYLTQAIDVPATLLKLAGVGVPTAFQGIDVLDPQRPPPQSRVAFQHSRAGGRGADSVVTASGWKFIEEHDAQQGSLQWRPTDLGSEADVAEKFPEVASCLQRVLRSWRSQQISYHRWPRYHTLFYAPRTPQLSAAEIELLARPGPTQRDPPRNITSAPRPGHD
jgi:arylsulfatase A-like enzyme